MGDQLGTILGGVGNTALGVGKGALDVGINTLLAAAAPSTFLSLQAQQAAAAADERKAGQDAGLAFLQSPQGMALLGQPGGADIIRQLYPQTQMPQAIPMEKLPPIPAGLPAIAAPSAPGDPTTSAYVLPPPPSELAASAIAQTLESTRRQLPVEKYGAANAQAQVGKDGKTSVQVQAGERADTDVLLTEAQVQAIGDLQAQGLKAQTTRQVNANGEPLYLLTKDKVAEAANVQEAKTAITEASALRRIAAQAGASLSTQNAAADHREALTRGRPAKATTPKAGDFTKKARDFLVKKKMAGKPLTPSEQELYDRLVRAPGSGGELEAIMRSVRGFDPSPVPTPGTSGTTRSGIGFTVRE